jgi:alpha-tubulin suppressor-like RCC1 family protein
VARDAEGLAWTWYYNGSGQLGDGSTLDRASPYQFPGLRNIVAVAAGDGHSAALQGNGVVWAWGCNGDGQ